MRVLNDKPRDEQQAEGVSFGLIALHSLFTALGFSSGLFSPLPLIAAHLQLAQPWPKVTALLGALIAFKVLDVSIVRVVILFVVCVFAADSYARGARPWHLLGATALVGLGTALGAVLFSAHLSGSGVLGHWSHLVDTFIAWLQTAPSLFSLSESTDWPSLRTQLIYLLPFFFVLVLSLSVWFSIGLIAHLKWVDANHSCSGAQLRKMRVSPMISICFIGFTAVMFTAAPDGGVLSFVAGAIWIVLAGALIVQGYVLLSCLFERERWGNRIRTLGYVIAFFMTYPLLVVMGAIAPWILKNKISREERT